MPISIAFPIAFGVGAGSNPTPILLSNIPDIYSFIAKEISIPIIIAGKTKKKL